MRGAKQQQHVGILMRGIEAVKIQKTTATTTAAARARATAAATATLRTIRSLLSS